MSSNSYTKYCSCNQDKRNVTKVKKNIETKVFNKFCTCSQCGCPGIKEAVEGLYGMPMYSLKLIFF